MSGRRSVLGQSDDLEEEDDDFELDLGDEEEEESDDSEEEESDETETEQPETPQQQEDYESRFKGLQGRLQQEVEGRQALQAQLFQLQAQGLYNQFIQQGRSPEDAQALMQAAMAQYVLQQQGNTIQSERQALEQTARIVKAQQLSNQYHIPIGSKEYKRLEQVKDPDDMEELAKTLSQVLKSNAAKRATKTVKKEQRKKTGADNFGKGETQTAPRKRKAKSLGDAADRFGKIKVEA